MNLDNNKNFTQVPNKIIEALMKINLPAYEGRLIQAIIRKTYGYHKSKDKISYSQFEELTGIGRRHIGRAINSLEEKNLIRIDRSKSINTYSINEITMGLASSGITSKGNSSPEGNSLLPKKATKILLGEVNTKDKKKRLNKGGGSRLTENDLMGSIGH